LSVPGPVHALATITVALFLQLLHHHEHLLLLRAGVAPTAHAFAICLLLCPIELSTHL
jgi:hypothetical protein